MFFQGVLGQAMTMCSQFGVGGGQARDPHGNPVGGGSNLKQQDTEYQLKQAGNTTDHFANSINTRSTPSSPAKYHEETIRSAESAQVAKTRNHKGG